ncbi:MAG: hypothetical protein EKK45_20250 [Curvibacter sp.]|nr:MAG: hypothetical protein EKK45_20250 [Curvibacter sp.]
MARWLHLSGAIEIDDRSVSAGPVSWLIHLTFAIELVAVIYDAAPSRAAMGGVVDGAGVCCRTLYFQQSSE